MGQGELGMLTSFVYGAYGDINSDTAQVLLTIDILEGETKDLPVMQYAVMGKNGFT